MQSPNDRDGCGFLSQIKTSVLANLSDANYGIEELCADLETSRSTLHRKLASLTGQPTSHYLRRLRVAEAGKLLLSTDMTSAEAAYATGFRCPSYFARVFRQVYGQSPTEYRQNGHHAATEGAAFTATATENGPQ